MRAIRSVRFLLCGTLLLGALSCTGRDTPLAPPGSALLVDQLVSWQDLGLMKCKELPGATTSAPIGPAGGAITVGIHSLSIPAGALSETVVITGTTDSARYNAVSFQPEGLQFAVPARLTMSYANCMGLHTLLPARIAYTTDALVILEYLLSFDDRAAQTVSADLDHFSKYAVAW